MSTVELTITSARLSDSSALTAFLKPIIHAERLREILESTRDKSVQHPQFTMEYDHDRLIAYFVLFDMEMVKCFTVEGLDLERALTVAVECRNLRNDSDASFTEILERVLSEPLSMH
jgi:hypothetical protein